MPGKSHGRRSLVGCSPWGRYESDTTERLYFHFSLSCIGEGYGNPLQCSCLENPRDRGSRWAAIYGVAQSRTQLKQRSSSSSNIHFCLMKVLVIQSCPTLCNPMNCSLPGSSVHGILQAWILEWVAMPFSKGSSQPRDWPVFLFSCIAGRFLTIWVRNDGKKSLLLYDFNTPTAYISKGWLDTICLKTYIYAFLPQLSKSRKLIRKIIRETKHYGKTIL